MQIIGHASGTANNELICWIDSAVFVSLKQATHSCFMTTAAGKNTAHCIRTMSMINRYGYANADDDV